MGERTILDLRRSLQHQGHNGRLNSQEHMLMDLGLGLSVVEKEVDGGQHQAAVRMLTARI